MERLHRLVTIANLFLQDVNLSWLFNLSDIFNDYFMNNYEYLHLNLVILIKALEKNSEFISSPFVQLHNTFIK